MASEHTKVLTGPQSNFLAALLTSPTIGAAAAKVGVVERTAYRWFEQDPTFRAAFKASKRASLEQAGAALASGAGAAVETLLTVCADQAAPASARVSAAGKVLDTLLRIEELDALSARLDELEAMLTTGNRPAYTNGRNHEPQSTD